MAKSDKTTNKAGRPTEAELDKRKEKIMEVATQMFVEKGFAETSFVDIAKGAGVATRTLYQHFGDKEAIFRDVIFAQDTGALSVKPPEVMQGDTLYDVLMKVALYAYDVAMRNQSVDLVRLMVSESRRFPDLVKKIAHASSTGFRSNIAKIFEELVEAQLTPQVDCQESTTLFVDLILGNAPLFIYFDWRSRQPCDKEIDTKIQLFVLGRFGPQVAAEAKGKSYSHAASSTCS